jgi:hypothetical protein
MILKRDLIILFSTNSGTLFNFFIMFGYEAYLVSLIPLRKKKKTQANKTLPK